MNKMNENINYYSLSFVGRRKNNEDNCIAVSLDSNIYFFAVADGMGGMAAGEVASQIVIDTAIQYIKKALSSNLTYDNMKETLFKAFKAAQVALANKIHNDPSLSGMGSTLSCVLIYDDKFVIGSIGDSRVYLLRNNKLNQITQDHNYITDYFNKEGKMPDKNQVRQYGHFITRALDGGSDTPDIYPNDHKYHTLKRGDAFLICSDGLITDKSDYDNKNFIKYLIGTPSLEIAAKNMISEAYYEGSTDNISVVLVEYGKIKRKKIKIKKYPYPPGDDISYNKEKKSLNIKKFLYIYIIIITIAIAILGINIFNSNINKNEMRVHTKTHLNNQLKNKKKKNIKDIKWEPLNEQFGKIILGKNENLVWEKPSLEGDKVRSYQILIREKKTKKILLKKDNIKTPKFSLTTISPGEYLLSLSFFTENGNNKTKTYILKVNE